jgi:hypothetical protein
MVEKAAEVRSRPLNLALNLLPCSHDPTRCPPAGPKPTLSEVPETPGTARHPCRSRTGSGTTDASAATAPRLGQDPATCARKKAAGSWTDAPRRTGLGSD